MSAIASDLLLADPLLAGLNPQQAMAVTAPAGQALKVLAGAGTGKTEVLARRFAYLCAQLSGEESALPPQERIALVTFTDKAATEMRERVKRYLGESSTPEDAGRQEDLWIGTFHQLATQILRSHAPRLGLKPDFTVWDATQQRQAVKKLLHRVKHGEFTDMSGVLNRHGLSAVAPDCLDLKALRSGLPNSSPPMALAPLLDSLPSLLMQIQATGHSPAQFWQSARTETLAFTECLKNLPVDYPFSHEPFESIRELLLEWRQVLAPWADAKWNPLACEQELEAPKEADYRKPVDTLLKTGAFVAFDKGQKCYLPALEPDRAAMLAELDAASTLERAWIDRTAAFYALYLETMAEANACDFDGLLNRCVSLLEQHPDVRNRYQQQFAAILVDEFQDSSLAQLRMIQLLRKTDPSTRSANLTVVGDEKQSIYGFRFAQPENLGGVFQGLAHETVYLQTNYRSHPEILAVANPLALRLTGDAEQILKAHREDNFTEKDTPPVFQQHTMGISPFDKDAMEETVSEKPVKVPIADLKAQEAIWIADELERMLAEDPTLKPGHIAVLMKTHAKGEALEQVLAERGIPAVRQRNRGLLQTEPVKTLLAGLSLVLPNPTGAEKSGQEALNRQNAALLRLLQTRLNDGQIAQIVGLKRDTGADSLLLLLTDASALSALPGLGASLQALGSAILQLQQESVQQQLSPLQALDRLEALLIPLALTTPWESMQQARQLSEFRQVLTWILETQGDATNEQADLGHVLTVLKDFASDPTWELNTGDTETSDSPPVDAVQLLTIHGSKGLEFPVVFVALTEARLAMADFPAALRYEPQPTGKSGFGLFFSQWNGASSLKQEVFRLIWQKPRQQAELQRLFYVALTRTKHRLYLLRAPQTDAWTDIAP